MPRSGVRAARIQRLHRPDRHRRVFECFDGSCGWQFLFNSGDELRLFNQQRLSIIILQVSIVGIIAIGVTQVIITGGIDLSSGSVVGATAMIAMSFAQVDVNGNPTRAVYPRPARTCR